MEKVHRVAAGNDVKAQNFLIWIYVKHDRQSITFSLYFKLRRNCR
jgi:hypothetical protein